MFFQYLLCLFVCYFSSVEMKPFKTMSQDLEIILQCNSTFPVNKRTLNLALIEKRIDDMANKNFMCFLHCLYYNYEWMDNNGVFQYINMKSTLSESDLDDPAIEYLISTCTSIENEDKCEKAFKFTMCFWAESEKAKKYSDDLMDLS